MRCQQGQNLDSIKRDFLSCITRVSELVSAILNCYSIINLGIDTINLLIEIYVLPYCKSVSACVVPFFQIMLF